MRESCSRFKRGFEREKRYRVPPGSFTTSPLRTAIDTGVHSLLEVLLQAEAATAEEENDAQATRSPVPRCAERILSAGTVRRFRTSLSFDSVQISHLTGQIAKASLRYGNRAEIRGGSCDSLRAL